MHNQLNFQYGTIPMQWISTLLQPTEIKCTAITATYLDILLTIAQKNKELKSSIKIVNEANGKKDAWS